MWHVYRTLQYHHPLLAAHNRVDSRGEFNFVNHSPIVLADKQKEEVGVYTDDCTSQGPKTWIRHLEIQSVQLNYCQSQLPGTATRHLKEFFSCPGRTAVVLFDINIDDIQAYWCHTRPKGSDWREEQEEKAQ